MASDLSSMLKQCGRDSLLLPKYEKFRCGWCLQRFSYWRCAKCDHPLQMHRTRPTDTCEFFCLPFTSCLVLRSRVCAVCDRTLKEYTGKWKREWRNKIQKFIKNPDPKVSELQDISHTVLKRALGILSTCRAPNRDRILKKMVPKVVATFQSKTNASFTQAPEGATQIKRFEDISLWISSLLIHNAAQLAAYVWDCSATTQEFVFFKERPLENVVKVNKFPTSALKSCWVYDGGTIHHVQHSLPKYDKAVQQINQLVEQARNVVTHPHTTKKVSRVATAIQDPIF